MGKVAFLFPGQGAQTVGMGKDLFESDAAAKQVFQQAADVLGYDLSDVCFNGPADKLNSTEFSQPALFVCSVAALAKLRSDSPELVDSVSGTAGLSLGEYTSLYFAGAMSFEDALRVVQVRGQAMQAAANAVPSGMVSVLGLEIERVRALCDESRQPGEILQLANLLCPGNIVVSGSAASCQAITKNAEEAGAMKVIPLAVAGAFHTEIMQPAVQQLSAVLASTQMHAPKLDIYSNVDAAVHHDPEEIKTLLGKQVVSPVLWEATIRNMVSEGYDSFYEVGPGRVLKGLMKRIDRKIACENIN